LIARIVLIFKASKPISTVWRNRLRALKLQRSLEYFGLCLALSVASTWVLYWSLSTMGALVPFASWPVLVWTVDTALTLGTVTVMLSVLSLFAYSLSAIQAWLPLWGSVLITGAIATLAIKGLIDIKLWLVQQGAHLYPSALQDEYLEWVARLQPALVFAVTVGTFLLVALSMYVQVRGTVGLLRNGESYRASEFFKAWSSPQEPLPHVWHIVRGLKTPSADAREIPNTTDPKSADRALSRYKSAKSQKSKAKRQAQSKARRLNRR